MEKTVQASQPRSISDFQRVGLASLFFANAVLSLWADGFHRLEWLPYACLGLGYLTLSARKKGEPFLTFLRKPQSILTYALIIVGIAGLGRNMYLIYRKHFG